MKAFGNTPPDPTLTSHTGLRPRCFLDGTVTVAVIVSNDSVSIAKFKLLATGRGPLPPSKLTGMPTANPYPVIVT